MTVRDRPSRILLLGARAPVTVELARAFSAAGHVVFVAESMGSHLLRGSTAVTRSYRVPAPRQDRDARAFAEGLRDVIRKEVIDLLVPTCEEVFHVARRLDVLAPQTRVLAMPIERLGPLHSKFEFIERTRAAGVPVPETVRVTDREALDALVRERGPELVLKPEYSRFASEVVVAPRDERDLPERSEVSPRRPWVAQRLLQGRALCTFSVAHAGHMTLHSDYAMEVTAGRGAAIVFRPSYHQAAREWVQAFVEREAFTGQVAFDFIEVPGEGLYAIECNPRATSGVHLFGGDPRMARAYVDPEAPRIEPRRGRPSVLLLPLLIYGWRTLGPPELLRIALRGRDVAFSLRDPAPMLVQALTAGELLRRAIRHRVSPLAASTLDIEWNGPLDEVGR